MAKAVVTAEAVAAAAAALGARGEEITTISVQSEIGGGSFTTVKRHLDAWRAAQQAAPPLPAPPVVVERATEFAQVVWAAAAQLASEQIAQVRAEGDRALAAAQAAQQEIATALDQLEAEHEQLVARFAALEQEHAAIRATLAATETARQVAEAHALEATAEGERLRAALAAAQTHQVEGARREGELAALREQLAAQRQLVERLAGGAQMTAPTWETSDAAALAAPEGQRLRGAGYADLIARYVYANYQRRGISIYREVFAGKSIIGKNRRIDLLLVAEATNAAYAIECKYQRHSGTADEKIPYALDDIQALRMGGCIVYAGEGWSQGVLHMLRASAYAAYCLPNDTLTPSDATRELDHLLAMHFCWWDILSMGKRPYQPVQSNRFEL